MARKKKVEKLKVEPEILVNIKVDGKEAIEITTSKGIHRYEVKHHGSDRWLAEV
jgi:hypothetical protein